MDGIESIAMPLAVPPAALQRMASGASEQIDVTDLEAIRNASDEKKKQLAKDFESVLLTKLFDEVRKSIEDSGFDDDVAADQVHGLFWSYLARDVANKGGFGLWQDLYQHFKALEGDDAGAGFVNEEL
jgi:Rod binding domain-containing protein